MELPIRREQRAFLLHFSGRCSAKSPHNRAGFFPQKNALVTSGISNAEGSAAFRLRFRDGRSPNRRPKLTVVRRKNAWPYSPAR